MGGFTRTAASPASPRHRRMTTVSRCVSACAVAGLLSLLGLSYFKAYSQTQSASEKRQIYSGDNYTGDLGAAARGIVEGIVEDDRNDNDGAPTNWTNFCAHDPPEDAGGCYELLAPRAKSRPAWFFLGDSQMLALAHKIIYPHDITSRKDAKDSHCGAMEYYGLPRSDVWRRPRQEFQGPTSEGLQNHFCSDVTSKSMAPQRGKGNRRFSTDGPNFMEVLVVDYANDVEQQSARGTETSQETVALYMSEELEAANLTRDDAVCVANAGLHDQKLCAINGTVDDEARCAGAYEANVRSYLGHLGRACGTVVWVSITSVRGDGDRPQRDGRSREWNRAANASLARMSSEAEGAEYFFLDVWDASSRAIRKDNIHFTRKYYRQLGRLFSRLMS